MTLESVPALSKVVPDQGPVPAEGFSDGKENTQFVLEFIRNWGPDWPAHRKNFPRFIAEDIVYENSGFPIYRGKNNVLAALDAAHEATGMVRIDIDLRSAFSHEDHVVVERYERWYDAKGNAVLREPVPIVGVFVVKNGLITAFRDYFDPSIIRGALRGDGVIGEIFGQDAP